ncbi:hypothetical protein [Candidatus Palauibacter sp.]|uniref:hypothetical protein n=1 Tax=Candidatus Palauibacter sp. TaxID=3101350 RepID=UPI003CC687E4
MTDSASPADTDTETFQLIVDPPLVIELITGVTGEPDETIGVSPVASGGRSGATHTWGGCTPDGVLIASDTGAVSGSIDTDGSYSVTITAAARTRDRVHQRSVGDRASGRPVDVLPRASYRGRSRAAPAAPTTSRSP